MCHFNTYFSTVTGILLFEDSAKKLQEFPQDPKSSREFPRIPTRSQEFPRVPRPPERMASAIYPFLAICLTFVAGSQHAVINNERTLTEARQFLEQNVTQDCNMTRLNMTLDTEFNLDCCEIAEGTKKRDGNPCDWMYKCDKNNFHCVLHVDKITWFCLLILVIFIIVCGILCMCFEDKIRRTLDNLFPNLQLISGRKTEANSMEMRE